MSGERIGLYPGTFDPVTLGHLDIVKRAVKLVDRLVIGIANNNELKVPAELAMLAKTMLNLDGVTRRLDPDYDPHTVIRDYAERLMVQKLAQKFAPRNFYPALLDLNQLVLDLPHRAREIIDLTAGGRLSFSLNLTQAEFVDLLQDHDPRIGAQLRVELPVPDVDRVHAPGAPLQQAVGDAARRSADVGADEAARVDRERVERGAA